MKRLRIIEALFVAALVLALAVLLSTQAHAAESRKLDACYATELDGQHDSADRTPHAKQCRATVVDMLKAIREDGNTCSYIVMFYLSASPRGTRMEVTCRLYEGSDAWYVSTNGGKFVQSH